MTISLILPAYNRTHLIRKSLNEWMKQTRLPDEILILENYWGKPELPLKHALKDYPWPKGAGIRHYYCDTTLRNLYPDRAEGIEKTYLQLGGLYTKEAIAEVYDTGKSLNRSGTWPKNVGAKLATGDILVFCDCEVYPSSPDLLALIAQHLDQHDTAMFASQILDIDTSGALLIDKSPHWQCGFGFSFSLRRETYIRVGGMDEIFVGDWGWDDESLAEVTLPRNGIKVWKPPFYKVVHQYHGGRFYKNHNAEATAYYRKLPKGLWKANESRGWMNWGEPRGWVKVG